MQQQQQQHGLVQTLFAVSCAWLQVGDVHGCYDALLNLLETVQYTPRVDNLILVGDLVDKGPKSREVGAWFAQV
jgi:Icc-related predicted phosphoesterase